MSWTGIPNNRHIITADVGSGVSSGFLVYKPSPPSLDSNLHWTRDNYTDSIQHVASISTTSGVASNEHMLRGTMEDYACLFIYNLIGPYETPTEACYQFDINDGQQNTYGATAEPNTYYIDNGCGFLLVGGGAGSEYYKVDESLSVNGLYIEFNQNGWVSGPTTCFGVPEPTTTTTTTLPPCILQYAWVVVGGNTLGTACYEVPSDTPFGIYTRGSVAYSGTTDGLGECLTGDLLGDGDYAIIRIEDIDGGDTVIGHVNVSGGILGTFSECPTTTTTTTTTTSTTTSTTTTTTAACDTDDAIPVVDGNECGNSGLTYTNQLYYNASDNTYYLDSGCGQVADGFYTSIDLFGNAEALYDCTNGSCSSEPCGI